MTTASDLGLDERVRGDPVQVQRVEDDDVAGADAPQQPIDVAVDPGGAGDTRAVSWYYVTATLTSSWSDSVRRGPYPSEARRNTSLISYLVSHQ